MAMGGHARGPATAPHRARVTMAGFPEQGVSKQLLDSFATLTYTALPATQPGNLDLLQFCAH
jgi:hypothetical protein